MQIVEQTRQEADAQAALKSATAFDVPWRVIVWNDPVNLMSYVVYVFRSYFGVSVAEAEQIRRAHV